MSRPAPLLLSVAAGLAVCACGGAVVDPAAAHPAVAAQAAAAVPPGTGTDPAGPSDGAPSAPADEGPGEAAAPPGEPLVFGAGEDPDDVLSRAWAEQTYREVVAALAEGPGLVLRRQVPVVVATNKEALARRREFSRQLQEKEGMTYGLDLLSDMVFGEGFLGRYFPDEEAFYLFRDNIEGVYPSAERTRAFAWGVMAHEMVHAYDDQVYESVPTLDDVIVDMGKPGKLEEMNAMMALIEGRATYAAELACEAAGVPKLLARTMDEVAETELVVSDGSPVMDAGAPVLNFVARAKVAQYVYGREFARRAFEFGGEKFFRHVFESLPMTMAEVQDFDRFKQRWARDLAERMEAEEAAAGP